MSRPGAKPETIGPYRVEKRLGAGGMGEVFLAYDQRLERSVALKWIRSDALHSPEARHRFLREARATAGLSHSAIVQIHDILELDDGPCIVMELIEGETLATVLKSAALPLPRLLALAREIADGLTAAHDKNILHRDLKTSNIMITPTDHAKILDFGLAKRLAGEASDNSLTAAGELVGTSHAMSPEQIQGYPVDLRSDLFSFGVVLYEAATGQRPFQGENVLQTLNQVLSHRQTPARELDPTLPQAFSDLIDQLLEKDPDHRPQSTAEVAALLAELSQLDASSTVSNAQPDDTTLTRGHIVRAPRASPSGHDQGRRYRQLISWKWLAWTLAVVLVIALGLAATVLLPSVPAPLYIAVLKPEISVTSESMPFSAEVLTTAVRLATVRALVHLEGVIPLAISDIDAVAGDSTAIAKAVAADDLLAIQLTCAVRDCQVVMSRLAGQTGGILDLQDFTIPIDDLPLLDNAVTENLRASFPRYRVREGAADLAVRAEDYAAYLVVRNTFELRPDSAVLPELLQRLSEIEESSPRFLEAHILEAQIAQQRFNASRDPQDLDQAFAAISRARHLDAEDPRPLFTLFTLNMVAGKLEDAALVLKALTRLRPGDATVLAKQAILEDRRGSSAAAITLMRTAVARHPSWANLYRLALIAYRQGAISEARQNLLLVLERFPEHFQSLSFLAQIELLSGHPRAVELYQNLVERSPSHRELANLGTALLIMRRYREATETLNRASALEPGNWLTTFSLAQLELLNGRTAAAELMFRKVLLASESETTSDSETLMIRAMTLAFLGERRQAVMTAQEALQQSSPHPFLAYQASLIYTLTGDENAALANVEKALQLNLGPRWFGLPWFDSLRDNPEFRQLLQAHDGGEFLSPRPQVETLGLGEPEG